MSNYAKINSDSIVENIIVCSDSEIQYQSGQYIKITQDTNPAQIGYGYVLDKNKFVSPQPYPSWTLNETSLVWESPVGIPENAEISKFGTVMGYRWDEENQEWVLVAPSQE